MVTGRGFSLDLGFRKFLSSQEMDSVLLTSYIYKEKSKYIKIFKKALVLLLVIIEFYY